MSEEVRVSFVNAELIKLTIAPGEVLGVKITSDDMDESHLESLKSGLKILFPNNKVMIFCVPPGDDLTFTAIQGLEEKVDCGVKACEDCSCGKKERLQALDELAQETENLGLTQGELK